MRASDAEVIEASLLEPSRFASIFDRHVDSVRRYVTRRAPPDVIDEVVSDLLRIAFERRASFDQSAGSALPWLHGIAFNVLRHQRRSSLRYSAVLRRADGLDDQTLDPSQQRRDNANDQDQRGLSCRDPPPVPAGRAVSRNVVERNDNFEGRAVCGDLALDGRRC
jgi:DNA-directed RNA polymerase specialized sigma24 family protein